MLKRDSNSISEDRLKKKKPQTTINEFHMESSSLFLTEQVCLFLLSVPLVL